MPRKFKCIKERPYREDATAQPDTTYEVKKVHGTPYIVDDWGTDIMAVNHPDVEKYFEEVLVLTRADVIQELKVIRERVWGRDIPHPGDNPNVRDTHEKIQATLKDIDSLLDKLERE